MSNATLRFLDGSTGTLKSYTDCQGLNQLAMTARGRSYPFVSSIADIFQGRPREVSIHDGSGWVLDHFEEDAILDVRSVTWSKMYCYMTFGHPSTPMDGFRIMFAPAVASELVPALAEVAALQQ